jgi:hypothetical protein
LIKFMLNLLPRNHSVFTCKIFLHGFDPDQLRNLCFITLWDDWRNSSRSVNCHSIDEVFPLFFQKKKLLSLNVRCYLFKLDVMYYNVSIFEIYFVHFPKLLRELFEVEAYVWDFLPNFKSSFSLVVPPERPFTQSPVVMPERGHMAFHYSICRV